MKKEKKKLDALQNYQKEIVYDLLFTKICMQKANNYFCLDQTINLSLDVVIMYLPCFVLTINQKSHLS